MSQSAHTFRHMRTFIMQFLRRIQSICTYILCSLGLAIIYLGPSAILFYVRWLDSIEHFYLYARYFFLSTSSSFSFELYVCWISMCDTVDDVGWYRCLLPLSHRRHRNCVAVLTLLPISFNWLLIATQKL